MRWGSRVYLADALREESLDGQTEQIVRRARRGESAAFSRLIGLYERSALAISLACTGDSALAGDVTQEAFLKAWQRIGELKDERKFGAWLLGIVRHAALDALRSRKREAGAVSDISGVADPADSRPDERSRREESEHLSSALGQLDEASRAVIVLRYFEQMSSSQIAELLEATPAAVDMRLTRARQTLKRLLEGKTCGANDDR